MALLRHHLCLFHYIYDSSNGGHPQDDGHSNCKFRKVQDDQGYLVFIITPELDPLETRLSHSLMV